MAVPSPKRTIAPAHGPKDVTRPARHIAPPCSNIPVTINGARPNTSLTHPLAICSDPQTIG